MISRIHLILLCASAIAIVLLTGAWRSARHESEKLAATLATQNATIQQAGEREKHRDAQLHAALASIQSQTRAVRTPQQAAKHLPEALPTLPLPITVHVQPLSSLSKPAPLLGSPETTVSIPPPDLLPLYNALQTCRASELQTESLQQNLSDEKARSAALLSERNTALSAARGGTLFLRFKRASKWFFIGLVTGIAVISIRR